MHSPVTKDLTGSRLATALKLFFTRARNTKLRISMLFILTEFI
jgi:hypothetical protein